MQEMTSATAYYHHQSMIMAAAAAAEVEKKQPELPEEEKLKCPRCDSLNTKFCYYNNYNLLQPRHYCKNCRRYWTKGGSLRNIPVGGGSRKNTKRSSSSTPNKAKPSSVTGPGSGDSGSGSGSKVEGVKDVSGHEIDPTRMFNGLPVRDPTRMLSGLPGGDSSGGSFTSLLASHMKMGGVTCQTGSGRYPGTGLCLDSGSGVRGSDDTWTDLAMVNSVENN